MKRFLSVILMILVVVASVGCAGSASAEKRITKVRVKQGGVVIRSEPRTNSEKVAAIRADEEVDVVNHDNGWLYIYYYGTYGWISQGRVTIVRIEEADPTKKGSEVPEGMPAPVSVVPAAPERIHDMGVPQIGNMVFREDTMNMVVFWVQTQLKATGIWYQGSQYHVTGYLGRATMQEIRNFMSYTGYPGHGGSIDQTVIDELEAFLGDGIVPVYVGGFYSKMDSLMYRDAYGTMPPIVSNMRDNIAHLTVGAQWVQTILKHLGYYSKRIDGMYGEETEKAVMRYQRATGFTDRDCVYLGVARKMLEDYYYSGGDLSRLP